MNLLRKHISNIPGWRTGRKIVVIESDDWGSVRTFSKEAYEKMLESGLNVADSNFTRYDALESNQDLEDLFSVLSGHKDSTGRPPVFTPMSIVANPNFKKIKLSDFQEYFFESFPETCKHYPNHDKVFDLWKKGIQQRLFVPQLHGREHLNVQKWMNALQKGNKGLHIAFDNQSFGAFKYKNENLPEYLAAFDPEKLSDILGLEQVISQAALMFNEIFGYRATHFIASNSPEPKSLEKIMYSLGIRYLTRYKFQKYPLGDGKFEKELNWLGKKNTFGQIYLTRNASFEPSDMKAIDPVNTCLQEIAIAFRWNKPAIISTHRVNYIGYIDQKNKEKGLMHLDQLLKRIILQWPQVEFMTSEELGNLIINKQL